MSESKPKGQHTPTPETIEFGRRVRAARDRLGWSQINAAGKLGIGAQALYRIESGSAGAVSLDRAHRIAVAWGVDPAELDERLAPSGGGVPVSGPPAGPCAGTLTVDLSATHARGFHLDPATDQDRACLERAGLSPDALLPADLVALVRLAGAGARAVLIRLPGGNPGPPTE